MTKVQVQIAIADRVAEIALNRPEARNPISKAMFGELEAAIAEVAQREEIRVVIVCGRGPAFCSGFDLAEAAADPAIMKEFIRRLSGVCRTLRRMRPVTIAAVHGAAVAGGCAIVSACDFAFVAPDATLGYPVHRIGVSPAVTIPTLSTLIGHGPARSLLMSGRPIDGAEEKKIGLASHLAASAATVVDEARALAEELCAKGPMALAATKAWLNELDGSLEDRAFGSAAEASAELAGGDEAVSMIRASLNARGAKRS